MMGQASMISMIGKISIINIVSMINMINMRKDIIDEYNSTIGSY